MGWGHAGGEFAARLAVETGLTHFREASEVSVKAISDCFQTVQAAIQQKCAEDYSLSGMRTTLLALACNGRTGSMGACRRFSSVLVPTGAYPAADQGPQRAANAG